MPQLGSPPVVEEEVEAVEDVVVVVVVVPVDAPDDVEADEPPWPVVEVASPVEVPDAPPALGSVLEPEPPAPSHFGVRPVAYARKFRDAGSPERGPRAAGSSNSSAAAALSRERAAS